MVKGIVKGKKYIATEDMNVGASGYNCSGAGTLVKGTEFNGSDPHTTSGCSDGRPWKEETHTVYAKVKSGIFDLDKVQVSSIDLNKIDEVA